MIQSKRTKIFRQVKLSDYFYVKTSSKSIETNKVKSIIETSNTTNNYPYISGKFNNNGSVGYLPVTPLTRVQYLNSANTFSLGRTGAVYFHTMPYFTTQTVKILVPKPNLGNINKDIAQYLACALRNGTSILRTWGNTFTNSAIEDYDMFLPFTKSKQSNKAILNMHYMKLKVKTIKTSIKRKILSKINSKIKIINSEFKENKYKPVKKENFRYFKISDIFNIPKTSYKQLPKTHIQGLLGKNGYNYISRTTINNGVTAKVNISKLNNLGKKRIKKNLCPANTLSFAGDTGIVFYQSSPYFIGRDSKVLQANPDKLILNNEIAQYIIVAINKAFIHKNWGDSFKQKMIENTKIQLPIRHNTIDNLYILNKVRNIVKNSLINIKKKLK